MANNPKANRDPAGARLERAQEAARDAEKARAQYEADGKAMREKTARLRSLRLAKEAADLAAGVEQKPVAPATKARVARKR
jgi:hypothetical protein